MKSTNGRRGRRNRDATRGQSASARPSGASSWQRLRDRYLEQAQAAMDSGDRIAAENFYQHADHYFRMIQGTAA